MAGSGFLDKEWSESIMQLERFKARKDTNDARLSGTSAKRFEERSKEWSVLATGARLDALMVVNELSARQRCLRNLHLEGGRKPETKRLGVLPCRCPHELSLEFELPDPLRLIFVELPLAWR
jgi:hypothetical protein